MAAANDNNQRIWQTVLAIPEGKVASYGQIADLAGLPGRARMVGKALGRAPDSLQLPWFRVVRSSGEIAFPRDSDAARRQTRLLEQDEVPVKNNRVRLKEYGWKPDLAEILMKLQF